MGLFFKFLILVLLVFFATESQAQFKPAEQQYLGESNIAINGGFEQGKTNWTNVNGTFSVGSTNKLFGQNAGCVTLTAQSLDLSNKVATSSAMSGLQGYVNAYVKTPFASQVCAVVDNVDTYCVDTYADNNYKQYQIPVVLGSTNLGVRVKSTSQTGTACVDSASFGAARLTQDIAQGEVLNFYQYGASCTFNRTATGFADFATVLACDSTPKDITGSLKDLLVITDTDLPQYTINNMPVGDYILSVQIPYFEADLASEFGCLRISDGTNFGNSTCHFDNNATLINGYVEYSFSLNQVSNKTFRLQGSDISVLAFTDTANRNNKLHWSLKYYPPKSKVIAQSTSDIARTLGTLTWASATNCLWSNSKTTTFTSYSADSDCNNPTSSTNADISHSGTKTPHFILPAGSKAGQYKITVGGGFVNNFAIDNIACLWRYSDGTNHSTLGSSYSANGANWDSSKTFILNLTSELSSATTFNLQSVGLISGSGTCELVNIPYTGSNLNTTVTVDYMPTDKKAVIIGDFKEIKTTDLYYVTLDGNDNASSITANTVNVQFNEASDPFNIWDLANRYLTVPSNGAGFYRVSGNIRSSSAIDPLFYIYVDTGSGFTIRTPLNGNIGTAQSHHIEGIVYLNAGDKIAIRSNTTFTVQNTANLHNMVIKQDPDLAGIVKNLNDNKNVKCQTKYQTSTLSSSQWVSNLKFNNLKPNRFYEVKTSMTFRSTNNIDVGSNLHIYNTNDVVDAGYLIMNLKFEANTGAGTTDGSTSNSIIFKAQNTSLSFRYNDSSSVDLFGDSKNFAQLCELPDNYVETTEF